MHTELIKNTVTVQQENGLKFKLESRKNDHVVEKRAAVQHWKTQRKFERRLDNWDLMKQKSWKTRGTLLNF